MNNNLYNESRAINVNLLAPIRFVFYNDFYNELEKIDWQSEIWQKAYPDMTDIVNEDGSLNLHYNIIPYIIPQIYI